MFDRCKTSEKTCKSEAPSRVLIKIVRKAPDWTSSRLKNGMQDKSTSAADKSRCKQLKHTASTRHVVEVISTVRPGFNHEHQVRLYLAQHKSDARKPEQYVQFIKQARFIDQHHKSTVQPIHCEFHPDTAAANKQSTDGESLPRV